MRILLASKRAPATPGRRDGGVQTWVSTVAAVLLRLGHEVDVADRHAVSAVVGYDLGIFANAAHTSHLAKFCDRALLVVHGIVPDESPAGWEGRVAFTSEEVRGHWQGEGPIIRQPIDLDFWSPGKCRAGRTLIRYANRGGLEWLPAVAERLRLEFRHARSATPEQARDALRDAACVLASGRCAVEAMACGAPVVICDDRPYQGPLMDRDIGHAMTRNYSGRGGVVPDAQVVADAVRDALSWGDDLGHVRAAHDVRKIVPRLLEAACSTC